MANLPVQPMRFAPGPTSVVVPHSSLVSSCPERGAGLSFTPALVPRFCLGLSLTPMATGIAGDITFVGGLIWDAVYQREPDNFALAVSHGVVRIVSATELANWVANKLRMGDQVLWIVELGGKNLSIFVLYVLNTDLL